MARVRSSSLHDRAAVASRVAAAVLGGYAFATALGVFLSRTLPLPRADAVLAMTLASFAIYTAAVIFVFAARTATRAWLGLAVPTLVLAALSWLVGNAP